MLKLRCIVCNYIYDEKKERKKFSDLSGNWTCPVCNAPKTAFISLTEHLRRKTKEGRSVSDTLIDQMAEWGIKYVFGIPGTSSLGLVDAVRKK
ncbi:MAG TPA: hypothetical protein G4O17_02120 [Dehalococcoidia bacterium]|nr:hypothetical protein [Dehalococcoidia bacterium]